MSNKGAIPDRIETEEYGDLLERANEKLLAEYPDKESTREFHSKRFRYWLAWCDDRDDADPWNPELDDVKNYVRYLKGERSSQRKLEHRVRGIRITYEILKQEGKVDQNPASDYYASDFLDDESASNVRTVAENKQGPTANYDTIEPEDFEAMLENVPAPRFRNQLILKLGWQLMLRAEEVTTIKLDNIVDGKNKIFTKDAKKDKNDEDLWIEAYYKDGLQYMLDRWRNKGRERLAPTMSDKSEYLIISHQSEQMNPESVSAIAREAAENAGVQEEMYVDGKGDSRYKVTFHTLRRSAATYLANRTDYPIHMLSDDLNHRSVDTTKDRYVREDPEERRSRRQDIDAL